MAAEGNSTVNFYGSVGNVNTGNVTQTIYVTTQKAEKTSSAPGNNGTSKAAESAVVQNIRRFLDENFSTLTEYAGKKDTDTNPMEVDKGTQEDFLVELKKCRLIFVTANSCEEKMATLFFHEQSGKKLWFRAVDEYSVQLGRFAGQPAAHIHPTNYGALASERLGLWLKEKDIHPELLVSAGVAYGMFPESQKIGDVLFSSRVVDLDAPHKETDGNIILSPDSVYKLDEHIAAAWKTYCANKPDWHWGTMLGKNAVLSDSILKNRLLEAAKRIGCKDVIGGEMEYTGFFRAAELCKENLTRFIGIKGICDWGEAKNSYGAVAAQLDNVTIKDNDDLKDLIQCYAAEKALEALAELIKNRGSVLK